MPFLPFLAHFACLPDPRIERTKRHQLLDILVISICALICGAEGWEDIEDFGLAKHDWLRERLGLSLENGIPSDDTFRRVFARLDPVSFGTCFRAWVQTLRTLTKGEVIALDGKTLRHSFDSALGQEAIHMVSAWASANNLVLGSVKVSDKSNEITAIPKLLQLIDIAGCIVTIDAMGCQKEIARQIKAQGGEYVLALKGNHPHLAEDVEQFFAHAQAHRFEDLCVSVHESLDKEHGRFETRRCHQITLAPDDPAWQDAQQQWVGLSSFVRMERTRKIGEKLTHETHYYLSSLAGKASKVARAIRAHWGIENGLHYVLDVSLDEDACRIRKDNAPQNLALLRHIVLNLLKKEMTSKRGVKAKQKRAGWDDQFLLRVLNN